MKTLLMSGNPVLPGWCADPEIHIFENRYYIYPTSSTDFDLQKNFEVFSSLDLLHWRSNGEILNFRDVPWSTNRAAWAPSCVHRNGKYYLYFSAGDGAGLGVAIAESPVGPFRDPLGRPLVGNYPYKAQPIDAHCFVDEDGEAYLYFGGHHQAVMARLNPDMISFATDFSLITPDNYVEGPFMAKRKGKYYFMWSEGGWADSSYRVAYAIADSPWGPFQREDIILQSNPEVGNGAGHHSLLNFPGTDEWIICYHRRPVNETNLHHRVTCLDRLEFAIDGRIKPVQLSHDGVPTRAL